jgi:hypothetical protein
LGKTKASAEQDPPAESLACNETQVIATEIEIQKAMTRTRRNCRCYHGGVQCHKRVEHPENDKSRWCSDCHQNRCNCECNGCRWDERIVDDYDVTFPSEEPGTDVPITELRCRLPLGNKGGSRRSLRPGKFGAYASKPKGSSQRPQPL